MATFQNHGFAVKCSNCELPARELLSLMRSSIHGHRIDLLVCRFCYVQLTHVESPRPEERQLRPWLRTPVSTESS
jgi:hypothetical protein